MAEVKQAPLGSVDDKRAARKARADSIMALTDYTGKCAQGGERLRLNKRSSLRSRTVLLAFPPPLFSDSAALWPFARQ